MITQKQLKKLLHYNHNTGIFTRIKRTSNSVKVGDIAGWNDSNGYIKISVQNKSYRAHRLAWLYMTGKWPKDKIDHINHICDDNRWVNLREATNQENNKNASLSKANTSGISGVSWDKQADKWRAQIGANSKSVRLGLFVDKFEAVCARKSAENKYGYHSNHGM